MAEVRGLFSVKLYRSKDVLTDSCMQLYKNHLCAVKC